jgi:hypothetical protein
VAQPLVHCSKLAQRDAAAGFGPAVSLERPIGLGTAEHPTFRYGAQRASEQFTVDTAKMRAYGSSSSDDPGAA